jgi:ABC-type branched-subunit amino acid transport system substrate-binding protein
MMAAVGALLAGCSGFDMFGSGGGKPVTGRTLGEGPVKVAVILPLTGSAASAGQNLLNAAELAFSHVNSSELQLLIKDDASSPDGARSAARAALAEGAEIIIGPLLAAQAKAAGEVARSQNKSVISFSTDVSAAGPDTYIMGFLPYAEASEIITYAASKGKKSVAALIPQSPYGDIVETALMEVAPQRGMRVAQIERYAQGQAAAAAQKILPVVSGADPQADTLFVPDSGPDAASIATTLQGGGVAAAKVKLLGTSIWSRSNVYGLPLFQGGWFAGPDNSGFNTFAGRYKAKYNADPVRVASLSYDAVMLVAALTRAHGTARFNRDVLTSPSGFAGTDGIFRFKADGTNDRVFAIYEVKQGSAGQVRGVPKSFSR